jgi:hypothetical protein
MSLLLDWPMLTLIFFFDPMLLDPSDSLTSKNIPIHIFAFRFKVPILQVHSTSFPNTTLTSCHFFSLTFRWVCCCSAVALLLQPPKSE